MASTYDPRLPTSPFGFLGAELHDGAYERCTAHYERCAPVCYERWSVYYGRCAAAGAAPCSARGARRLALHCVLRALHRQAADQARRQGSPRLRGTRREFRQGSAKLREEPRGSPRPCGTPKGPARLRGTPWHSAGLGEAPRGSAKFREASPHSATFRDAP